MLDPKLIKGVYLLAEYSFTYDTLIYSNQLEEALQLVSMLPERLLIVAHIAKPAVRKQEIENWKWGIASLAECDHVVCKAFRDDP